MAVLPSASVGIDDQAGGFGSGDGYLVIMSCVERNADLTPRVFSSAKSISAQHGYSQGLDLAAAFIDKTRLAVIFIGLPTVTPGAVGRQNSVGVLGSSVISVAAGPNGILEEVDAILTVTVGGTIGTSGIVVNASMDGGLTWQSFRLGTGTSLTIPSLGIVLNFAAGTLLAGDTYTFGTSAPKWDTTGVDTARIALAAQQKLARSWLVIGDLQTLAEAQGIVGSANSYETANQRFIFARVALRDRLPLATKSKVTKAMTGAPSVTFAAAGNTITRATGSFVSDGFLVGDVVNVGGTTSNNGSRPVTAVTATVLTVASGVVNEGPIGTATIAGSDGLVFAATSVTRSAGSWIADGFRVGDTVTFAGTVSNNGPKVISALTALVLSFASGGVTETIASSAVSAVKGETKAAWISALDATFGAIDSQKRIDLGAGRLRQPRSLVTSWRFRRPVQWPATIREYQHDLHIPTWRKSDGPLDGWDLDAGDGNSVEYDERTDGGALAARFTCARTYGNGPIGAFIALSLTRWSEASVLSRTHNMAVANLACTQVQASTENAIGVVLELNPNGTGKEASLSVLEEGVNRDLQIHLLQNKKNEGKRASSAVWKASRTDLLNGPGATLTGVLTLNLNGTIEQIQTSVKVNQAS